ncbi:MAG: response regulator [Methanomicrobiales archaeon]|nr:response regulator [Methanomicrobiales archaeon]
MAPTSVLFVDDEPVLRDVSKRFLEKDKDLAVDTCASAKEALGIVKKRRYDVIVSDYEMPVVDGIEFLKQLRGEGNSTPFIIFSGKGREEVVIEALNNGADFYIQKGGDPKAQFVELKNQIQHIDQRKRAEAALMQSEARYRLITDNMSDAVWLMDKKFRLTFISPSSERKRGFSQRELLDMPFPRHLTPESKAIFEKVFSANFTEERLADQELSVSATAELEFTTKDGSTYWAETTLSLIRDAAGKPFGYVGMARDVTERRKADEKILASLHEKEILLREIHHRVKNNLQIIASLLYLQSLNISDSFTIDILRESRSRVKSMALIHEKLYRSEDLALIPFATYLESLIENLKEAYGITDETVSISVTIDPPDLSLNIETGIPCGLIVNELISNSMKHAFRKGTKGAITITVRQTSPYEYTMTIGDNGPGFPKDVDFKNTTSLGLQLVNNLVTQLDGDISLDCTKGSVFTMHLKAIEDYTKK